MRTSENVVLVALMFVTVLALYAEQCTTATVLGVSTGMWWGHLFSDSG